MFRHFIGSRRILAIILVAGLALVQAKIAFAGCIAADTGAAMAVMGDCEGCDVGNVDASRHALSKICGNHCLQDFVSGARDAGQADPTAMVMAADAAAIPPLILPDIRPAPPGKTRLIHRLQRLLL